MRDIIFLICGKIKGNASKLLLLKIRVPDVRVLNRNLTEIRAQ